MNIVRKASTDVQKPLGRAATFFCRVLFFGALALLTQVFQFVVSA